MDLYITRPSLSGEVDICIKDKQNKIVYENNNFDLSLDIESLDTSDELTVEIKYVSKLIITKKDRLRYFHNVFWYHIFPLFYKDNDLYKFGANLYVIKTFHVSKFEDDAYLEYEPYHECAFRYEDDRILPYREEVKYKYKYLTRIALVLNIMFYLVILGIAIYCNYLWIKEVK